MLINFTYQGYLKRYSNERKKRDVIYSRVKFHKSANYLLSDAPILSAKWKRSPGGEATIFPFLRLQAKLQAVGINPAHCSVLSSWKRKAPKNHIDVECRPIIKRGKKKQREKERGAKEEQKYERRMKRVVRERERSRFERALSRSKLSSVIISDLLKKCAHFRRRRERNFFRIEKIRIERGIKRLGNVMSIVFPCCLPTHLAKLRLRQTWHDQIGEIEYHFFKSILLAGKIVRLFFRPHLMYQIHYCQICWLL